MSDTTNDMPIEEGYPVSKNIFLRDISFYQRDLNPIQQYIEQSSFYLAKIKGIDYNQAFSLIESNVKGGKFPSARDPIVQFYERPSFEDKEITYRPLSNFISGINEENLTMAPSMTCYVHASECESILSGFTDDNVKLRNIAKKTAAKFKALNDMDKFRHYNGEQENKKLYNNAMSGAYSSGGSIVRNPSAHSSLTSVTRTMTSIGNASNERIITGNRHYRNADITLNNVVVLAHSADAVEIRKTLDQFNLKTPTVKDVMDCLDYSCSLYWHDRQQREVIHNFVKTLTDEERAAVVYTGDLYQLRRLNPEFVRTFITTISRKVTNVSIENPIEIIKNTDEMYVNYVHQICKTEVEGIGKDYTKISPEKQSIVAATCLNLRTSLEPYGDLIRTFFLTKALPPSVAYIRDSVRRSVVLSDTDSTMFSCDEWVQWYFDDLRFTDEAYGISGAVMFVATQCIAHSLALYSANLNVERKKLFMASMKPEFVFPVFALTSVGKHYFTYALIKEGSVYKVPESEQKGVHLKNSAAPKIIMKDASDMMNSILDTVLEGKKISLTNWIMHVSNLEREIRRSVLAGETTYLGRLNIKSAEAYKGTPELSNFRHHLFWEEVFKPSYGSAPTPTYAAVKFPTTLCNKRALELWITDIKDQELSERLKNFLVRNQRKDLNTIYIARDLIEAYGVPQEIKQIIDVDSMILEHCKAHRLILETIGFFGKENIPLYKQGY